MQDRWYYKTRSGVVGPLTDDELAAALRDGALTADSPVRHGIGGRFQPLSEAIEHASGRLRGTREVASELLAQADRVVVSGGPVGTTKTSLWESLTDSVGSLAALLLWPLAAAWNWLRTYIGRKTLAALVLAIAGILLLRMVPVLDPPLGETHRELSAIWEEAQVVTAEPVDEDALAEYSRKTLPHLKEIAESLERSHQRRSGYNIWTMIRGRRGETAWAQRDLLLVAKHELPALLRSPETVKSRGPQIESQLDRVGDHLAAVGKSPYATATPRKPAASKRGKDVASSDGSWVDEWDSPWIKAVLAMDMLLVLGGGIWWWRRRGHVAT